MTFASVIFGMIIAAIPACLVNFLVAGNGRKLLVLIVFAWIGFFAGQLLAMWRGWSFLKAGPLVLSVDLIVCLVFIGLGYWLTNFQPARR
jgi:hypothetical protein